MAWQEAHWIYLRLSESDHTAVEEALAYLERDPWEFASGYAKANLMRRLKQLPLGADDLRRIEVVLLNYVDIGQRWEFREACYLARVITRADFRDELVGRLDAADVLQARRACSMLLRLRRPRLRPSDREAVRVLLLRSAAQPDREAGRVHVGQVRAVWSLEWGRELARLAGSASDAPEEEGARRLLSSVPRAAARVGWTPSS